MNYFIQVVWESWGECWMTASVEQYWTMIASEEQCRIMIANVEQCRIMMASIEQCWIIIVSMEQCRIVIAKCGTAPDSTSEHGMSPCCKARSPLGLNLVTQSQHEETRY